LPDCGDNMPIRYDPMQAAYAKANIIGGTASGISSNLIDFAQKIPEIVKRKNIDKEVNDLYGQSLYQFADDVKNSDPSLEGNFLKAMVQAKRFIKKPMQGLSPEQNIKLLLGSAERADKYLEGLATKSEAAGFTGKMQQPITEQRQVQAEGPPIPAQAAPERAGEVPMEMQEQRRPIRGEEYQREFAQLSPAAQEMVPETLGKQVESTEQVFQQPLKMYEEQREQENKQREKNIRTMTGVSKESGFHTAIIESQNAVEGLRTKKRTLDNLTKTVIKTQNLDPRQIESGKQTDLMLEIERIATELDIPQQLADDPEFLGRMNTEIDRLINKEEQQQSSWDTALTEWQKRMKEEDARKRAPRQPTVTPDWKLGKELQAAVKNMAKQQFPNLYKVIEGEYGVEVMKQTSGIADAARAILRDPQKRIALAYAFPEEVGAVAQAKGAPKPPDEEIQAVLSEMQQLQDQVYGVIQGTGQPAATPTEDPLGLF